MTCWLFEVKQFNTVPNPDQNEKPDLDTDPHQSQKSDPDPNLRSRPGSGAIKAHKWRPILEPWRLKMKPRRLKNGT
jgi:hypothetical protein